ncbi:hypothetical protein RJZ56_000141 [Blastomyces dermatitidis]|uniref:Uncharacterized protein n=2 Tax=Blastomyces TaxID=229219 RepID=A0A179UYC4_BLAGS|nr:uncharacterized protein BDBG_07525 [Blastomyces gilchristii SLH14081]XP_045276558.1 uncharacterized protein BDCG_04811 [Blastomyces dermatitidis ER-3]EEQ89691.1 hypothetical protein BDCG_04811 [Blastomyces dermatitidis ER-3]OAT12138.1 hypothetical protein BDBG_07525 [Blastomyces gilchristii SLH14081]
MEDSFPPLPGATGPNGLVGGGEARVLNQQQTGEGRFGVTKTKILCSDVDVVLEFTPSPSSGARKLAHMKYLMGVSSTALKESSTYFRVILDPDKFREGRELFEKTAQLDAKYGAGEVSMNDDEAAFAELPTISIELPPLAGVFDKADLIETFLRVLYLGSAMSHDDQNIQDILNHLAKKSISFVANLIVLSDKFGGQEALKRALNIPLDGVSKSVGQTLISKTLRRLQSSRVEDEERTRQAIYFALFLGSNDGVLAFTHMLIIDGSREWVSGGGDGWVGIDRPLWWHLPHGIEEELRFRHESILDTITDLQSHFLRAYGALPPESSPHSPQITDPSISAFPLQPPQHSMRLQCRRMYENSRACDSFHLGEIIRFFTTRTKTLHLESTLPPHMHDSGDSEDENADHVTHNTTNSTQPPPPPTNIATLLASLRQCPEYQIDPNHIGCGLRRRLLPALDCLASFTTNSTNAVGICPSHFNSGNDNSTNPYASMATRCARVGSWRNHAFRDAIMVGIGAGKVDSITYLNDGRANGALAEMCTCVVNAELARAAFTARRRAWNL